jgi:GNAT superfamily N-acetyltransferase
MPHEIQHGDYSLSDDPARLDVDVIHRYLADESYWAGGVARSIVIESVQNSLCIGAYASDGTQVGLARVVTDYATHAWLCDVFVLSRHRGHGLGKGLVNAVISHPRLQTVRRITLGTRDAHGLYQQFGFKPLEAPDRQMERRFPDRYPYPTPRSP